MLHELKTPRDELSDQIAKVSATLGELVASVESCIQMQICDLTSSRNIDAQELFQRADPERWLENARNSLQSGLMFLTRAYEQPTRF